MAGILFVLLLFIASLFISYTFNKQAGYFVIFGYGLIICLVTVVLILLGVVFEVLFF